MKVGGRGKSKKPKTRKPTTKFKQNARKKNQKKAAEEIRERLERVAGSLEEASRVRIHTYKDGSVDGELLVKVPRGTSTDDLVRDMESAMGRESMSGYWINMGVRFTIKKDDEVYRRFRGMNDVNTHYQAAVPANWSEIPLIVRKVIVKGMEKKYGRKTESVYLRLHWNKDGSKP